MRTWNAGFILLVTLALIVPGVLLLGVLNYDSTETDD